MYSVKDVANKLDISRQAIYKKLDRDIIKQHVTTVEGIKYISEEGFQLLKGNSLNVKDIIDMESSEINKELATDSIELETKLYATLNSVIDSKDKDIEYLREENKILLELMQQQNQLLNNSQKIQQQALSNTELLLLEKRQQLLLKEAEYKLNQKKSFKERLMIFIKGN